MTRLLDLPGNVIDQVFTGAAPNLKELGNIANVSKGMRRAAVDFTGPGIHSRRTKDLARKTAAMHADGMPMKIAFEDLSVRHKDPSVKSSMKDAIAEMRSEGQHDRAANVETNLISGGRGMLHLRDPHWRPKARREGMRQGQRLLRAMGSRAKLGKPRPEQPLRQAREVRNRIQKRIRR